MTHLTEEAGGQVEDGLFVVKPGVILLYTGQELTEEGARLIERMNINTDQPPEKQVAELAARLTYFSFPQAPESLAASDKFHDRLRDLGHTSPYRVINGYAQDHNAVMLFAGICAETALEVIANKGHEGRVSTSRTEAMSSPLFRLDGSEESQAWQRMRIKDALESKRKTLRLMAEKVGYSLSSERDILDHAKKILRASLKLPNEGALSFADQKRWDDELERFNRQDPGSKALYLVDGKSLQHWGEWFLQGRLKEWATIEAELLEVLIQVADKLHSVFPERIKSADEYMSKDK